MSSSPRQQTAASRRSLAPSAIAALGLTLLALGCGKAQPERLPTFPVQGSITFKGQPIVGAVVALHPKNAPADKAISPHGNVTADGSFDITTYSRADGAPEGDYVVTVFWYKPVKKGADTVAGPNVIPNKYTSPETSDLIVKVAAGPNTLEPIRL